MKISGWALAAALVLTSIGGAPAAVASPGDRHDGQMARGDNGRHEGWRNDDRGRHRAWRNHHRRYKVCRNVWRHHHRQRVCTWRWR